MGMRGAWCFRSPGGDESNYAIDRHKTHITTEYEQVQYRWHPWYGKRVQVSQKIDKGGCIGTIYRCCDEHGQRRDLAGWLFDRARCAQMALVEDAFPSWSSLLDVKQLLESGGSARQSCIIELKDGLNNQVGGADGKERRLDGTDESVCRGEATAGLGVATGGGAQRDTTSTLRNDIFVSGAARTWSGEEGGRP
jgi:hypothetical protein